MKEQFLSCKVAVALDIDGYHFDVLDFSEIHFPVSLMDFGVGKVTRTLRDAAASMQFLPAATPATEIPLLPGQFILQIVLDLLTKAKILPEPLVAPAE